MVTVYQDMFSRDLASEISMAGAAVLRFGPASGPASVLSLYS